jgi:hypothetical protein
MAYGPPLMRRLPRKVGSRSPEVFHVRQHEDAACPTRPLGDETYARLLAYILQENGAPSGPRELAGDPDVLKTLMPPAWPRAGGGGLAPGALIPPSPSRLNPLDKIRPVTEAMLTKVADGVWLTWRRTYNAYGFSPLKKIKGNVADPCGRDGRCQTVRIHAAHTACCSCTGHGDKLQARRGNGRSCAGTTSASAGVAPSVKRGI